MESKKYEIIEILKDKEVKKAIVDIVIEAIKTGEIKFEDVDIIIKSKNERMA